jgi:3-hydroxyacyl-[acyl-carrier-protein] dehydratase
MADETSNSAVSGELSGELNVQEIMGILPHRYPFLMIDRIVEIERLKRIVAIKNVSINEPFFQGHFPGFPIMPGALVVEAMAQAGGVLLLPEVPDRDRLLMVFTGIKQAKFRRPVRPGDQLRIEAKVLNWKPRATRLDCQAHVDGKLACEAIITCQLVERGSGSSPGTPEASVLEPVSLE